MKNHEWKAMGRVIYGSRKTAFFEEKKANFAARTGRRITSMLPAVLALAALALAGAQATASRTARVVTST